ncbi:hypothetical protein N6H13_24855 [Paenibacillus sp. CC-CFT742]|uniref:hypothetical protein n=1 Tax=Paenibacillus xylanilyticus TaxID=248903 RepID=UPI0025755677|nr:hypothetical protein [Paenibacillus sp. CC-CFT742]WJH28269.1 hypothetical protein N6H13_24855 [Paenibacillus sp. CC-CFT742]
MSSVVLLAGTVFFVEIVAKRICEMDLRPAIRSNTMLTSTSKINFEIQSMVTFPSLPSRVPSLC